MPLYKSVFRYLEEAARVIKRFKYRQGKTDNRNKLLGKLYRLDKAIMRDVHNLVEWTGPVHKNAKSNDPESEGSQNLSPNTDSGHGTNDSQVAFTPESPTDRDTDTDLDIDTVNDTGSEADLVILDAPESEEAFPEGNREEGELGDISPSIASPPISEGEYPYYLDSPNYCSDTTEEFDDNAEAREQPQPSTSRERAEPPPLLPLVRPRVNWLEIPNCVMLLQSLPDLEQEGPFTPSSLETRADRLAGLPSRSMTNEQDLMRQPGSLTSEDFALNHQRAVEALGVNVNPDWTWHRFDECTIHGTCNPSTLADDERRRHYVDRYAGPHSYPAYTSYGIRVENFDMLLENNEAAQAERARISLSNIILFPQTPISDWIPDLENTSRVLDKLVTDLIPPQYLASYVSFSKPLNGERTDPWTRTWNVARLAQHFGTWSRLLAHIGFKKARLPKVWVDWHLDQTCRRQYNLERRLKDIPPWHFYYNPDSDSMFENFEINWNLN